MVAGASSWPPPQAKSVPRFGAIPAEAVALETGGIATLELPVTPATTPNPPEGTPFASAAVLGLSLRQLRDWEAQATQLRVVCPRPEHEAWEDTELDLRRTVL